ncbi:metallophosphoesterase [Candidatus Daviesbacteria bacterium]|nr:metallophosphoesterase [Candidatus Daviesbacteria bacterium]
MFGRKKQARRSTNILFVIFRLFLSVIIFAMLLGGIYSAYKHFSGLDPLKLSPEAVLINLLKSKTPQDIIAALSSVKLTEGIAQKINQRVSGGQAVIPADPSSNGADPKPTQTSSQVVLRFLMVADSHNDNQYLAKALDQAKLQYPDIKFILGLGDYTEVGTVTELKNAKKEFDQASLRYFLVVGDHDLWDGRDKGESPIKNFNQVFGPTFQAFSEGDFYFILLNNSDNYQGVSLEQTNWLDAQLEKAKNAKGIFVFLHESLYHPSSDHVMGRVQAELKKQAQNLLFSLKSAGVKTVIAGDTHYFSYYEEPQTHLPMATIGAITSERNLQTPRFGIGEVLEDGNLRVVDVEIK